MGFAFVMKKIIGILLMPVGIVWLLLVASWVQLFRRRRQSALWLMSFGLLFLTLFSYRPFAVTLLRPLETHYPGLKAVDPAVGYVMVLGSGHKTDETLPITSQLEAAAVVRLSEGIRVLNRLNPDAELIVSGYGGLDETSHALMQKRLAVGLGVDPKRIIVLEKPKDTQEEARAAAAIIGKCPFVLVTSAAHMPRAMKWFGAEGLHPLAAPTNHVAKTSVTYWELPNAEGLCLSQRALHEYLGLAWYSLKGAI
jgi:uncharacterized SAM-binding protein YcdF (DUF218 family)